MVNPLLGIVLGVLLVVAGGAGWFARRPRQGAGVRVAHTRSALEHPRLRRRLTVLRVALVGVVALAVVGGGASAYVAARPAGAQSIASKLATRDIMLCLDVSGSVIDYDAEVLRQFAKLVEGFEGERVGMSFFNSGSRLVFPLTSDYELITGQINDAVNLMTTANNPAALNRLLAGTDAGMAYGSSLIGDGLVSCLTSFDLADQQRARSVVFATDNQLAGNPVFTLAEAVQRAARSQVTIHGLYVSGTVWSDTNEEMQFLLSENGMHYYAFNDFSAAPKIVAAIQAQDAADLVAPGDSVVVDTPGRWPAYIGAALLVLIALAWRFKL
ncbi:VWA domain-containing protein [Trueperella pecoris]|uniref:VWA domain-containing protein n=1 Tax=Trueperella pecoris TaxID=2733571 RepID=A0A7M1R0T7_9ACTO|nr:vWA domain-containing protein [Trueperella pecoris]QOR47879.1 VWA domain-containing protein [Trueperella pecoris]